MAAEHAIDPMCGARSRHAIIALIECCEEDRPTVWNRKLLHRVGYDSYDVMWLEQNCYGRPWREIEFGEITELHSDKFQYLPLSEFPKFMPAILVRALTHASEFEVPYEFLTWYGEHRVGARSSEDPGSWDPTVVQAIQLYLDLLQREFYAESRSFALRKSLIVETLVKEVPPR